MKESILFKKLYNNFESIIDMLRAESLRTTIGDALMPLRSQTLMQSFTYANNPVDCVLFAIEKLNEEEPNVFEILNWLFTAEKSLNMKVELNISERLANAVKLDLYYKLHCIYAAQAWEVVQQSDRLLPKSKDYKIKEILASNSILLAFHLEQALQYRAQAQCEYDRISQDESPVIYNRTKELASLESLNPKIWGYTDIVVPDFIYDETKIREYINKLCMQGDFRRYYPPSYDGFSPGFFIMALPIIWFDLLKMIPQALISKINGKDKEEEFRHKFQNVVKDWFDEKCKKILEICFPESKGIGEKLKEIKKLIHSLSYCLWKIPSFDFKIFNNSELELQFKNRLDSILTMKDDLSRTERRLINFDSDLRCIINYLDSPQRMYLSSGNYIPGQNDEYITRNSALEQYIGTPIFDIANEYIRQSAEYIQLQQEYSDKRRNIIQLIQTLKADYASIAQPIIEQAKQQKQDEEELVRRFKRH